MKIIKKKKKKKKKKFTIVMVARPIFGISTARSLSLKGRLLQVKVMKKKKNRALSPLREKYRLEEF